MPDLSELDSTLPVKIAGASSSGIETSFVNSSVNGDLQTQDILRVGGVYGQLTVGTTAVEAKVGVSRLSNRKLLTVDNTSNVIIYWGYDSSVTATNYAGRIFKDQQAQWGISDAAAIWFIAGSAGNIVRVSEGA